MGESVSEGIVYIAGPISGLPNVPLEDKIARFHSAEKHLIEAGYEVRNPLKTEMNTCRGDCNPEGHIGQDGVATHSWACFMRHDLPCLLECDTIAILPGWMESRGARLEIEIAQAVGMKEIQLDFQGVPIVPPRRTHYYEA